MPDLEKLREMGYTVGVAHEGEDYTAYRVEGHGISLMLNEDDEDSWNSIMDQEAHDERVRQAERVAQGLPPVEVVMEESDAVS
jgi:hypothetical protein